MLFRIWVSTIPFVSSIAFEFVDGSSELPRLVREGSSVGNYREVWLVASTAQGYNERNVIKMKRGWGNSDKRRAKKVLLFCDARQSRHHTWQGSHSCQDSDVYCSKFCAGSSSQIISECEQDIVLEISANNLYASCQHYNTSLTSRLLIFSKRKLLTSCDTSSSVASLACHWDLVWSLSFDHNQRSREKFNLIVDRMMMRWDK